MNDQILDFCVIVLPTLISLGGILFTLEPLNNQHKLKWRWSLLIVGVAVSGLTFVQQERQRAKGDTEARSLQEHMIQQELQIGTLTNALNTFTAKSVNQRVHVPSSIAKIPTADEIAAALDKHLVDSPIRPIPSPTATPASQHPLAVPTPTPSMTDVSKPCRGDRLSDCSDKELVEWAKPMMQQIAAIEDKYMADLKALDDIKGGNWIREVVGIGDKNSRWLKAHAAADETVAESFRNCCAESAISYYKELAQRSGAGLDKTDLYEWMKDVTKPPKSREYKNAKQDGGKIIFVRGDLRQLEIQIDINAIQRQINARQAQREATR
jgi:hypothetical protein